MKFKPIVNMQSRLEASKDESDISYFYDLIGYAEMVVKFIAQNTSWYSKILY